MKTKQLYQFFVFNFLVLLAFHQGFSMQKSLQTSSSSGQMTPQEEADVKLRLAIKGYGAAGLALAAGASVLLAPVAIAAAPLTTLGFAYLADECLNPSERGDPATKKIDEALASGARINGTDSSDFTPLMYAAYYGHPILVRHLLSKGADKHLKVAQRHFPNWKDYTAYTIAKYYYNDNKDALRRLEDDQKRTQHYSPKDFKVLYDDYTDKINRYHAIMTLLQ